MCPCAHRVSGQFFSVHAEGQLGSAKVGLLHGRLAPEEKIAALEAFSSGDTPVLISTTVVEVASFIDAAAPLLDLPWPQELLRDPHGTNALAKYWAHKDFAACEHAKEASR